jgi:hypothetical protein
MKRRQTYFFLWLFLLMALTGCSVLGTDSAVGPEPTRGGAILLPPAWTPTPISIPGTGGEQGTWQPCDDGPPSQLEVGDLALVEGSSFKIRLRSEPGLTGTLTNTVLPGDIIQVVNGPACFDQLVWWEVQSMSSGDTGWTAEGNEYGAWLLRID